MAEYLKAIDECIDRHTGVGSRSESFDPHPGARPDRISPRSAALPGSAASDSLYETKTDLEFFGIFGG